MHAVSAAASCSWISATADTGAPLNDAAPCDPPLPWSRDSRLSGMLLLLLPACVCCWCGWACVLRVMPASVAASCTMRFDSRDLAAAAAATGSAAARVRKHVMTWSGQAAIVDVQDSALYTQCSMPMQSCHPHHSAPPPTHTHPKSTLSFAPTLRAHPHPHPHPASPLRRHSQAVVQLHCIQVEAPRPQVLVCVVLQAHQHDTDQGSRAAWAVFGQPPVSTQVGVLPLCLCQLFLLQGQFELPAQYQVEPAA
jgi:hypothetical protein